MAWMSSGSVVAEAGCEAAGVDGAGGVVLADEPGMDHVRELAKGLEPSTPCLQGLAGFVPVAA